MTTECVVCGIKAWTPTLISVGVIVLILFAIIAYLRIKFGKMEPL
jgi:hypothetical protein